MDMNIDLYFQLGKIDLHCKYEENQHRNKVDMLKMQHSSTYTFFTQLFQI